ISLFFFRGDGGNRSNNQIKDTANLIEKKDSIIKILAIGNSFSQDAVEYYLQDLADAAGYQTMIGNVYSGGASLEGYMENAAKDNPVYNYRKIDADGKQNLEPEVTVKHAIQDEEWDYISF